MTNKDKINQMSSKELAEWLRGLYSNCIICEFCGEEDTCGIEGYFQPCVAGILMWLESEVEER